MSKDSKLYSILHETCPRCHEGKVFKHRRPYESIYFTQLNRNCDRCGQAFEPEPGFYQGAMYVSYALSLTVCFTVGILMTLLFDANAWVITLVVTLLLLVLIPPISRLSRMVWLNLFVRYEPLDTKGANR